MRPYHLFLFLIFTVLITACFGDLKHQVHIYKESKVHEHEENDSNKDKVIKQTLNFATKGMVQDSNFRLLDSIDEVHKSWGNPSKTDVYKEYHYDEYSDRNFVFGYSADGEIFDIRSYNKEFRTLTTTEIISSIGKPSYTRNVNDETIYGYKLKDDIELKFIVSDFTGKVDHISVYMPVENEKKHDPPMFKETYILDVKGTSDKLSGTAWANMKRSREEMKVLAKDHEGNIFLNGLNQKIVALTFDDGPDNEITPGIINILTKYQVRGSFFFIGEKVQKNQDVVKKAYHAGNLVLSHSFYHNDLSKEGKTKIAEDLRMSDEAIKDVIGKSPAIFRPPYGATNEHVISTAKDQNLKIVLWSIDTLDWSQKETNNISQNVLRNVRNGDIILFHSNEDKIETLKALPSIIMGLQKKGFRIVTLDKLLEVKAYK
jgi:peptidoglycan-N-acetylglucosamine deacetylase